MNLLGVFAVAKAHSLTAIAAYALESVGIYEKDFEEEKFKSIRKSIILDSEREKVFSELGKAGIWYLPLKGIVIKELYPKIGMRQMADNDILFDKSRVDDVRDIMESLGFSTENFGKSNQDVYYKPPVCNFEMHTNLFNSNKTKLYTYYVNVSDKLTKTSENSFGQCLSNKDYYIYIIAHAYKHFSSCGTGLRSMVDTYVYLTIYSDRLDMDYIHSECRKLGISEFEIQNRKLAMHMLNGKKLTSDEESLFDYYVFSGTYGNVENRVKNNLKSYSILSKIKYTMTRIVVVRKSNPLYHMYAARYKWFYENRIRLPLLFFYRIGIALTQKRMAAKKELKELMKVR